MRILFSPIGNTDPWRNDRDGAMLNIVRHYKPDLTFLFFTESIWEGSDKVAPHRLFNWEEIIKKVSNKTSVECMIEKIEDVNGFDSYKDIFHKYLVDLENRYPDAEFLLNVTSGTPQMETTLCLEYITYPSHKDCIQVTTPLLASNANTKYANPEDQEIDLEIVNIEESKSESRCQSISIISFREAMIRNQVKSLIENYDYEAILWLLDAQKSFYNGSRIRSRLKEVTKNIKTHEVFPSITKKYRNNDLQKALFHFLLLDMRFKRRDIAEVLIRVKSITEFVVEKYLNRKYVGLIKYTKGKPYINLFYNPKFMSDYHNLLKNENYKFDERRLLSFPAYYNFFKILEPEGRLIKKMSCVNDINGIRNDVAHNLENLNLEKNGNEEKIVKAVRAVKEMISIVFPEIKQDDYEYFTKLNKELKELL
ncbi:type III-A CRISPR-associated CARF protein Csm6 [Enterococcus xiangfangensis]|uniref:Type III-A CRISPR-associated CARF protein Csm6 n=1 Tax=Enterococcus xiangfangensis TaxID=1296537 RepID=A0ABU3FDQ5_9ENTE|nr:type III-A CRISPR-associated CARF protein Csm6 [Enterococcus xiangfangensis]MDT2760812.1 type III-A CRISPR-associated CARF protein Csm6 [Enterococcus xiangfangensis]